MCSVALASTPLAGFSDNSSYKSPVRRFPNEFTAPFLPV
jgi:hypothetical protein